jgi:hypothetical protein
VERRKISMSQFSFQYRYMWKGLKEIPCIAINRKMRPVETIPGMGKGGQRRVMEG